MTQRRRRPQSLSEENRKAKSRARKSQNVGGKPAHQVVQRHGINHLGAANPESIKGLQQTVGNRVVSQLVSAGEKAGSPAVQREAITPASEEKDMFSGATAKGAAPGAAPGAPMPFPNMSEPAGGTSTPKVSPGSKMGSGMGDEPGTMKGLTSATTVSNDPSQSAGVLTPSTGIVPFQAPGSAEQEAEQPAQTPPQPEEQEAI